MQKVNLNLTTGGKSMKGLLMGLAIKKVDQERKNLSEKRGESKIIKQKNYTGFGAT